MGENSVPHAAAAVKSPDITEKWAWHKRQSQVIALQLAAAGYGKRADRMAVCSDVVTYRYCRACDSWHVERANLCRDRLCSTCNWRLSLQRYALMQRVVHPLVPKGLTWCLVTLTVQNCLPAELAATINKMMACWHRALQRTDMRAAVGWARGLELTYNAEEHTLHPHMHILVAWPPSVERSKGLIKSWMELTTRAGLVVDIKAQHSAVIGDASGATAGDLTKEILETYKYSIKGSDILEMPVGTLRQVAQQWGGRRLMALGGLLKTSAADERALDDVQDQPISACRSCGSVELDRYLARWSMGEQVYKIMELRRIAPDLYPPSSDISASAAASLFGAADAAPREREDLPVLLNTINGRILMYPGGAYQLIDPPISP